MDFPPDSIHTIEDVFGTRGEEMVDILMRQLAVKQYVRFSLVLYIQYHKEDELGAVEQISTLPVRSQFHTLYLAMTADQTRKILNQIELRMNEVSEQICNESSGWRMDYVTACHVEVGRVSMKGSGRKRAVTKLLNGRKGKFLCDVQEGEKDHCFFNAVALGLCDSPNFRCEKEKSTVVKQIIKTRLKTKNYKLPFSLQKLKSFERRHKTADFAINVYTFTSTNDNDEMELLPIYKSILSGKSREINLLYLIQAQHFLYIKDLSGLCSSNKKRGNVCFNCMWNFHNKEALRKHKKICSNKVKIEYPSKGDQTKFQSFNKKIPQPIFGVLDFESSLVPITRMETAIKYECVNCFEDGPAEECKHSTTELHRQIPTTFCLMFADLDGKILYQRTINSQDNLMKIFFSVLSNVESEMFRKLQRYKVKTDFTVEENERFKSAQVCHLCNIPFNEDNWQLKAVRDHCHYTNRYLGAAHSQCNLQRQTRQRIPIFVHNFKNYDSHFLLQAVNSSTHRVSGLPVNYEKFRTLTINKFAFIDSMELIPGALGDLVTTLSSSNHPFTFLNQMSFCKSEQSKKLLLRKGVYPYEWASSVQKLVNSNCLPPRKDFFSSLKQEGISSEDYAHAVAVFKHFHCKNMLDYCELYCQLDTVLLLEIISSFRTVIATHFNLDVTQYISTPQLAYDCMLTTLKSPIEKMSDPDMVLMCEQNIRGGVSFINVRQSCPDKIKTYLDANNLYSVAQVDYVPIGNYKWVENLQYLEGQIEGWPDNADTGFILCVDLTYPEELHDIHSSMPLAPEQTDLTFNDLSPYAQDCLKHLKGKTVAEKYKSRKLCSTLRDKKNYVVHYRNLKFYLKQGLVLNKIHRAFSFRQAPVLREFIEKCTDKRQAADTKVEKNYWKLICNSVYGKFIQDNRKHFDVKFATSAHSFTKRFSNPWFKSHRIVHENLVTLFMDKSKIALDRLYAIGFTILELSKLHMYASYYDFFLPALGGPSQVELVLTDTDSLVLQVSNMTQEEMHSRISQIMDYSNYPSEHKLFNEAKKAIPGYFKDENSGNVLKEVVGLKAKCYALEIENSGTSIVCKGVGKVGRNSLTLDLYKSCINSFESLKADTYNIQSKNHQLYTQKIRKVALSTLDDKRFLLACGKHTLPHGHYRAKQFICHVCQK
jgi:hypothetical protein